MGTGAGPLRGLIRQARNGNADSLVADAAV
jgi:hypothetical protein